MALRHIKSFFISRDVALLALAQAFANTLQTMGLATTPLVAYGILEDKSWATAPLVFVHLGLMAATMPASLLMARIGRKAGFTIGTLIGMLAGAIGVLAVYQQSFWLLCLTAVLQGASIAIAWYYRFAAADAAAPDQKARAISLVLLGGILSGTMGGEMAKFAKDLLAPVTFAGIYVMFAVACLISLVIIQFLSIPPPQKGETAVGGRPVSELARQPAFIVAVLASMVGYGVMTVMMSVTPLAMQGCGFSFSDAATVIQFHSVSMFAPALVTGWLIGRFGVLTIIAVGAIAQIACVLVAASGIGYANFMLANILVGIGWNFAFIGGSALLTSTYRPAERAKAQGTHDLLVYTTTAVTAGLSGYIQHNAGWQFVNLAALPLIATILLATAWLALHQRRAASVAQQP